jgi:hypothetical protein
MLFREIDFSRSRLRTDFGKGFYMGTNLGEARRWAVSQSMINETPKVIRYVLTDAIFDFTNNNLKRLWFSAPTVEWLDFVRDNRRIISNNISNKEPRHDYDIVYGPIANDKVVDVVDEYIDGLISVKEAITRVRVIPSIFQISFHTSLALKYINPKLTEYQSRVIANKWSDWNKI